MNLYLKIASLKTRINLRDSGINDNGKINEDFAKHNLKFNKCDLSIKSDFFLRNNIF